LASSADYERSAERAELRVKATAAKGLIAGGLTASEVPQDVFVVGGTPGGSSWFVALNRLSSRPDLGDHCTRAGLEGNDGDERLFAKADHQVSTLKERIARQHEAIKHAKLRGHSTDDVQNLSHK
jgi:hypothetical protein